METTPNRNSEFSYKMIDIYFKVTTQQAAMIKLVPRPRNFAVNYRSNTPKNAGTSFPFYKADVTLTSLLDI